MFSSQLSSPAILVANPHRDTPGQDVVILQLLDRPPAGNASRFGERVSGEKL
jgi:hypothetical protein